MEIKIETASESTAAENETETGSKREADAHIRGSKHRRFLVVYDLGKPCVITGLEVKESGYCDSNLRRVRIAAAGWVPQWVKHVGAAQESKRGAKINPEQDYTRNPEHPASQLRWVQVEANKDNNNFRYANYDTF